MVEIRLPDGAIFVMDMLRRNGYAAYAVGGCVRDSLRGEPYTDVDIATDALPGDTERALSPCCRVVRSGAKYGTVTAIRGGVAFEITTFRTEAGTSDARHPDKVEFVRDIVSDLCAGLMAWSPDSGLTDPFGGNADIKARVIRCVGDPETRFREDALRIMRAMRFASTLGFDVEPRTSDAVFSCAPLLREVSAERIYAELIRLAGGENARGVLTRYGEVIRVILPSADISRFAGGDTAARLASLFASGSDADAAMLSLKAPRAVRLRTVALARLASSALPESDADILIAAIDTDPELLKDAAVIAGRDDIAASVARLERKNAFITPATLVIRASELIDAGLPADASLKQSVKRLCRAVISGECRNSRDELIIYAKKAAGSH